MKKIICITLALSSFMGIMASAHSGRTDRFNGHKDNKNKSGLGSYHYHCNGKPAHLHSSSGSCLYTEKPKKEYSIDKNYTNEQNKPNAGNITFPSSGDYDYYGQNIIKDVHWAQATIDKCLENSYFDGFISAANEPDSKITRAMLITALYNIANPQLLDKTTKFTDISSDYSYYEPIIWGNQTGLINGISETKFAPNDNITREQASTILDRFITFSNVVAEEDAIKPEINFLDKANISLWAKDSVVKMQRIGILNGHDNFMFAPKDGVTIGELSKIIDNVTMYMIAFKPA